MKISIQSIHFDASTQLESFIQKVQLPFKKSKRGRNCRYNNKLFPHSVLFIMILVLAIPPLPHLAHPPPPHN